MTKDSLHRLTINISFQADEFALPGTADWVFESATEALHARLGGFVAAKYTLETCVPPTEAEKVLMDTQG